VKKLWSERQRKIFLHFLQQLPEHQPMWMSLRVHLRLRGAQRSLECRFGSHSRRRFPNVPIAAVHRFTELIEGQTYTIEVSLVGRDRWRANLARTPGVCGALMPFYGTTPDTAARTLAEWLARARRNAHPIASGT